MDHVFACDIVENGLSGDVVDHGLSFCNVDRCTFGNKCVVISLIYCVISFFDPCNEDDPLSQTEF